MPNKSMTKRIVVLYILNTLADWELGFAISELNSGRYFKKGIEPFTIKTFALTKESVKTMGGMRIIPDVTVDEIKTENCALLLLPGSDIWFEPQHEPVFKKVKEFLNAGIPVAAICGATLALANAGILDNLAHTSNDLNFLKSVCSSYKGEKGYREEPAVTDGNLITASGIAPLEFAYHIFKRLDVFDNETLEAWYMLYKTREPKYFFTLMQSTI